MMIGLGRRVQANGLGLKNTAVQDSGRVIVGGVLLDSAQVRSQDWMRGGGVIWRSEANLGNEQRLTHNERLDSLSFRYGKSLWITNVVRTHK